MKIVGRWLIGDIVVSLVNGDVLTEGLGGLLFPVRRDPSNDKGRLLESIRKQCEGSASGSHVWSHQTTTLNWDKVAEARVREGDGDFDGPLLRSAIEEFGQRLSPHVSLPLVGRGEETLRNQLRATAEAMGALIRAHHTLTSLNLWSDNPEKLALARRIVASWQIGSGWHQAKTALTLARWWLSLSPPEAARWVRVEADQGLTTFSLGENFDPNDRRPSQPKSVLRSDGKGWVGPLAPRFQHSPPNVDFANQPDQDLDRLLSALGAPTPTDTIWSAQASGMSTALDTLARVRRLAGYEEGDVLQLESADEDGQPYAIELKKPDSGPILLSAQPSTSSCQLRLAGAPYTFDPSLFDTLPETSNSLQITRLASWLRFAASGFGSSRAIVAIAAGADEVTSIMAEETHAEPVPEAPLRNDTGLWVISQTGPGWSVISFRVGNKRTAGGPHRIDSLLAAQLSARLQVRGLYLETGKEIRRVAYQLFERGRLIEILDDCRFLNEELAQTLYDKAENMGTFFPEGWAIEGEAHFRSEARQLPAGYFEKSSEYDLDEQVLGLLADLKLEVSLETELWESMVRVRWAEPNSSPTLRFLRLTAPSDPYR